MKHKKKKQSKRKESANDILKNLKNKLQSLTLKNYINILGLILIIVSATYVFFQYKLIFFPDGQLYYSLAEILLGRASFTSWAVVRGFGFPLIIMFWVKLFGDTSFGLLIGTYTFYLFLILGIGYLVQKFIKINNVKNKGLFFFLYLLVVVFNPLIIGYSHTLLTEAVMPGLFLLTVMLCFKWYKINFKEHKKVYILINGLFILLAILIWFIKQPYAPTYYIAILMTAIYSSINLKSWKELGKRMVTVVLCLLFMGMTMLGWDTFISSYNNISTNQNNSKMISNGIVGGLGVYNYWVSKDIYCDKEYIENLDISEKEKTKIQNIMETDENNWCSHLVVYELKNKENQHIATEVIIAEDDKISFMDNFKFLMKMYIKHPTLVIKSYFYNYLAIADIQERDLSSGYRSSQEYSQYVWGENLSNGMHALTLDQDTVLYGSSAFERFNENTTPSNIDLMNILLINNTLCFYLYKILILLALPIFIYACIRFIKHKNINYFMISLLSLMAFTDAFFHTFMGTIIDRYAYPVYPLMLLCMLLLFMDKKIKRSDENEK